MNCTLTNWFLRLVSSLNYVTPFKGASFEISLRYTVLKALQIRIKGEKVKKLGILRQGTAGGK